MYTRKVDGLGHLQRIEPRFSVQLGRPFCVELEALDLASGAMTTSGRQCFGDEVADQLGLQMLDPPEDLGCALQICEPIAGTWDLERCTPYGPPPSDPGGVVEQDSGCGCISGTGGDAGALAGLGLLTLFRRRRA